MTLNARQYLADRIFSQFKDRDDSPHVNSLLDVISSPFQDTINACQYILDNTDIYTAEGDILDIYGEMIGVYRPKAQEQKVFILESLYDTPYDYDNDHGFYDSNDSTGGYFSGITGTPSIDGSEMSDEDYLDLILTKASTFRKRATKENMFSYLLRFGARCIIENDDKLSFEIEQLTYDDFDHWQRNYVLTEGFDPGGINISIKDNTEATEL
jgi:hypothetical protein